MTAALVASFGELMLRLTAPGRETFLQSPRFDTCFGGAEANVAVALARLGTPARFATVLPPGSLGDAAIGELRGHGVDTGAIARIPGRLGLYFVAAGSGPRASEVMYDRAGSAFAVGAGVVDWPRVLDGATWLHVSGVTVAVSAEAEAAALAGVRLARERGVRVSFDCNFRVRLWEARGGDPRAAIDRFVAEADLVFADHRDVRLLTGEQVSPDAAADRLFALYPALRHIAGVTRDVASHDRHRLTASLATRGGGTASSRSWSLDAVIDRVGGGDAFAAGLLHALCDERSATDAIEFAAAVGALKHTLPGDFFRLDAANVERALAGSADIRR